jgi:hypothetical protein
MSTKESRLIEIFAGTAWEAGLIKSLLENAKIQAFLKDEIRGTSSMVISGSGTGGVKILISDNDYQTAKTVMEDYYKNRR